MGSYILFCFLLLHSVCDVYTSVHLYVVKYYNIVDVYDVYVLLTFSYWLVLYLEAVSPNMDFWKEINWIELTQQKYKMATA
jgi:hypothetical protein